MGQLASSYDYRVTNRGGKGIGNMVLSDGAEIVGSFVIEPVQDQLMLITQSGQVIRIDTGGLRRVSRNSRGVKIFDIAADDRVVSVARLVVEEEDDNEAETEETQEE